MGNNGSRRVGRNGWNEKKVAISAHAALDSVAINAPVDGGSQCGAVWCGSSAGVVREWCGSEARMADVARIRVKEFKNDRRVRCADIKLFCVRAALECARATLFSTRFSTVFHDCSIAVRHDCSTALFHDTVLGGRSINHLVIPCAHSSM